MEQQQIVSAEEEVLLKCFAEQSKSVKPFPGQREVICIAMKEYASLKLQSITTERDEALKANDLLCKKVDEKDEEIANLKAQVENGKKYYAILDDLYDQLKDALKSELAKSES
jgi:hypothetical protein